MATLPYVTATGNVDKALNAIKEAATPPYVSQDFVKTILKIPGGSGDQMTSFLKKIGFTRSDRSPSELYVQFRNTSTSGAAAAEALKIGYAPLYKRNEYMHDLPDDKLRGLIIEETGQSSDSTVVTLVLGSISAIKKHASWSKSQVEEDGAATVTDGVPAQIASAQNASTAAQNVGVNLSYTINLNLPATSDVAVFNAIFKSLKENMLKNG